MSIKIKIESLRWQIEKAVSKVDKTASDIKLIAVTKTQSAETIEEALQNGIQFIGENKIQEAEQKIPILKGKYKEFHFIGHLQSNKIKKIIPLQPTLIHSIDKFSTAKKIDDFIAKHNLQIQNILIQINTSDEMSKFGIYPTETSQLIKQISELPNIRIKGLMTIGVFTNNEKNIRKCFQILKQLFEKIKQQKIPRVEMKYLSMGMSNDYKIAIEEGANIIRVGTAIFGTRK